MRTGSLLLLFIATISVNLRSSFALELHLISIHICKAYCIFSLCILGSERSHRAYLLIEVLLRLLWFENRSFITLAMTSIALSGRGFTHRIWRSEKPPIIAMLALVVLLLLKTIHIDARAELERRDAAYAVMWLIHSESLHRRLLEYLDLVALGLAELLASGLNLHLRGAFNYLLNRGGRSLLCKTLSGTAPLHPLPHQHLAVWFLRRNSFKELLFVNFLVCIKVDSSDNSEMILTSCLFPLGIEKALKVLLVDIIQITIIDCFVGCIFTVSLASFQLLLEFFCVPMHLNLHQQQLSKLFLYIQGQIVISTANHVRSLSCLSTQSTIGTGKDDLHEVGIMQFTIEIWIKKLD